MAEAKEMEADDSTEGFDTLNYEAIVETDPYLTAVTEWTRDTARVYADYEDYLSH